MSVNTIQITLNRNANDVYTQSFNVWGKSGTYPQCDGDGTFVGNFPIATNATQIVVTWVPPGNGNWFFVATSVFNDTSSLPARLTV